MDFQNRIIAGREAISRAVVEGHDLATMWRESDPDKRLAGHYRRHQVVSDPDYGFTVVVLLWEPGAVTPVHDHDTWCVFGVIDGALSITNYAIEEDVVGQPLLIREVDRERVAAGILGDNRRAGTEIHRVRNTGGERAVSVHVYGADVTLRKPFEGRGIQVVGEQGLLGAQDAPVY